MADKRITDLPELIQADSGDFIPIVDSSMNVTKRVAAEKILPNTTVLTENLAPGAVTSEKLAPAKSVDGNGWTVYDYGTWKKYMKRVTYSVTVANNAYNNNVASSANLPTGMSTLGTRFLLASSTGNGLNDSSHGLGNHNTVSTSVNYAIKNISGAGATFSGSVTYEITD